MRILNVKACCRVLQKVPLDPTASTVRSTFLALGLGLCPLSVPPTPALQQQVRVRPRASEGLQLRPHPSTTAHTVPGKEGCGFLPGPHTQSRSHGHVPTSPP